MNEHVLPWYRSFWPWFLFALLASAVAGSCLSAYLAYHTTDVVLAHDDQAG